MPGLPLNTTKNRGRPGDVIGCGLGHGYVSPPTRPRANCAHWLWTSTGQDNGNRLLFSGASDRTLF